MGINEDTVVTRIEKIIEETPTEELNVLTVQRLAELLELDENLVTKKFKRKRNFSVSRLIKFKKLQKAYNLLKINLELSVGEISNTVGYDDVEYFGKVIKKTFGKTPSQIKNENKKD